MKKDRAAEAKGVAASILTIGYIVTQGGMNCGLVNVSGLHKGGVLMPGQPVIMFLKLRDARRAIERTQRCTAALRGSMIEEWARQHAPTLFVGGKLEVAAVGRQA